MIATNIWDASVLDLLEKKRPNFELLENSLIDEARQEPIDFFEEHLHLLRKLLFITAAKFFFSEDGSKVVNAILYRIPSDSFKLAKLYHYLIGFLAKKEIFIDKSDLLGDFFSENEGWWKIGSVYSPVFTAEMGILFFLIGLIKEDDDFIQSALKIADRQLNFLDKQGFPFLGLWLREKDFAENNLFLLNQILFSIAGKLTEDKYLSKINNFLTRNYPATLTSTSFSILFDLFKDRLKTVEKAFFPKEESTLLIKDKYSFVASLTGFNSGIGALHGEKVRILNIGPHRLPLGDCELFGIERDYSFLEDINIENERISGWTKIPVDPNEKDVWIFCSLKYREDGVVIEIKKDTDTPLAMTFFVFAENAEVLKKHFKSNTLDKYKGKGAEVIFKTDNEIIKIIPTQISNMELIPLSGNKNFWGATFLLSFNLSREHSHRWRISYLSNK